MLLEGLERLSDEQRAHAAEGMQLLVDILGAGHLKPQPLHG